MRERDTVEVPRTWLILLAGGLVVALLVVAYFVGKESGRGAAEEARAEAAAASLDDEGEYDDGDDGEYYEDDYGDEAAGGYRDPVEAPPGVPAADPWGSLPESAPPPARAPVRSAPTPDPQAAAVAAYFTELEGYERGAKYWNNPQELAMRLVGQGAQGDTSGFRQLVETQRTARQQIEAMSVPSPCREHHRRTLEVMRQAVELLEQLERGVASGNLEGLLSMTGESRQLEADAREVDALATELKRQHGV